MTGSTGQWLPLVIFVYASLTDFLDGYLARRWQVVSDIGRLLDPNADKLLVAVALTLLVQSGEASAVAVSLILCRELFISALREFASSRQVIIHVTTLAKWKTAIQMVAVVVLLAAHASPQEAVQLAGQGLLWLATALTLLTGWQYWQGVREHLLS